MNKYKSNSHAMQDKFALDVCGKIGTWLEIGACEPYHCSNTALLESNGWSGISIEIDEKYRSKWESSWRKNTNIIFDNALSYDYSKIENKHFNYISLDIEPPKNTYMCLERIIECGITFDCLTFEHDVYSSGDEYKNKALTFLEKNGYKMVIENVQRIDMKNIVFEDWYVSSNIDFKQINFRDWVKNNYDNNTYTRPIKF